MRRIVLLLAIVVCAPSLVHAKGSDTKKMSEIDAARFDAAVMHATQIMTAAQRDAAPYQKTIEEICKRYDLDVAGLGKTWGVDPATGVLTFAPKPESKPESKPAAKPPSSPPPPAPKK